MLKKRFLSLFLAAVMVLSLVPGSAWAADSTKASTDEEDGIVLDKTLTPDGQGTYTLDLEAYATGEVTSQSSRTPVDITIIMDVSGSMAFLDMGTKATKGYSVYSSNLAEAYSLYQAGEQFCHRTIDGDYHNVDIIYLPKFSGYLYSGSSSGYSREGSISSKDIYAYRCENSSCKYGSYYPYVVSTNGSSISERFTGYEIITAGTGSSDYFSDEYELYCYTNKLSRMEAMQNAVNEFIANIAEANKQSDGTYYPEAEQHRIGMVKFSGHIFNKRYTGNRFYQTVTESGEEKYYSSDYYGYTSGETTYFYNENMTQILLGTCDDSNNVYNSSMYVNSGTLSTLQNTVSSLYAGGATRANNGLNMATKVLNYNETSVPGRKQVVLFFTDGEPTTGTTFEEAVANGAISYANTLKESGATVYAINISPSGSASADMTKYMNRVSSNYEGATSMTSGGTNVSSDYYKDVANAAELSALFADIQEDVISSSVELTQDADLRDYMNTGVEITDDTVVTVYTADYLGNKAFAAPKTQVTLSCANGETTKTANGLTVKVDRSTGLVSVTGFDYKANMILDYPDGTYSGQKIMLKITGVDVTDAAPVSTGGVIYTNKDTSGVYPSTTSDTPADSFPRPTVKAEKDALILDKTATMDEDKAVTIQLEAFSTGSTYVYQERTATDITIILDVSGSMDWYLDDPGWTAYTGSMANSITQQSNGTHFAHKASDGTYHEVTLKCVTGFTGYLIQRSYNDSSGSYEYAPGTAANRIRDLSDKSYDVYYYTCTEDSCNYHDTFPYYPYAAYTYSYYGGWSGQFAFTNAAYGSEGTTSAYPDSLGIYYATSYSPRMDAMKEAVNSFIDQTVSNCAGLSTDEQHRIAMVKFAGEYFEALKEGNHFHGTDTTTDTGSSVYTSAEGEKYYVSDSYDGITDEYCLYNCAQILSQPVYATSANGTALKNIVTNLQAGGATEANYGFQLAGEIVGQNTAGGTEREQIVLFFTDGSPTSSSDFEEPVASAAILAAKALKDNGAKVYAISLSPEGHADATNMHQYLELVSSNYPTASSLSDFDTLTADDTKYHLTVQNTEQLDEIFETISQSISGSTIKLNSAADLRDYLAKGVNLTNDSEITVQTADYKGKVDGQRTWGDPVHQVTYDCSSNTDKATQNGITITVDRTTNAISVTGFNYMDNYVDEETDGTARGKKLIVTITNIEVTDEAELNKDRQVYTNKPTSGVYPDTDPNSPEAGLFPMPQVPPTADTLTLNKTAELSGNGTYTIDLEAFATGRTQSFQETNPVDITIVMDLSGSMKGNDYGTKTTASPTIYPLSGTIGTAMSLQNSGTQFYHKTADGELHEVTLFTLDAFYGLALFPESNYETGYTTHDSENNGYDVYGYRCDDPACMVETDNTDYGNGELGYPYAIINRSTKKVGSYATYYTACTTSTAAADRGFGYDANLYYDSTNISRIEAMQEAVNTFIAATAAENEATSAGHRISLIKFSSEYFPTKKVGNDFYASSAYEGALSAELADYLHESYTGTTHYVNALGGYRYAYTDEDGDEAYEKNTTSYGCSQILSYSQYVDNDGSENLQAIVNRLTPTGVTMSHYGMLLAKDVVDHNKLAEDADERQQVVLFFTDGKPEGGSDSGGFDTEYANSAINYAKQLKDSGAIVYTISLMIAPQTNDDGTLTEEAQNIQNFLQYISSNYPSAESLTAPGEEADTKYTLSANSMEELEGIFETITNSTISSSLELTAAADLRDYLAAGFELTEDSQVIVSTAAYDGKDANGNRIWKTKEHKITHNCTDGTTTENGYTVTTNMETGAVSVTGFDFPNNYVVTGSDASSHQGAKLMVTITGIKATDEAIAAAKETNDGFVPTNLDTSGVYPSTDDGKDPIGKFPIPKVQLTSKIYVLDYAKTVTLPAADWMASAVTHLDVDGMNYFTTAATTADETYGLVNKASNTSLTYQPQTTLWGGYDSFYSFGKRASDSTENLWSKISVLPANNVYYEDTFVTTQDSSTVGIQYGGTVSWGEYTSATSDGSGGESGQNGEDVNGEVHGWITDLANDTGFSDGSAHGITLGDNEMAKATFKFTGTGVDVYTYTDIQSGIVQAVLMKLNESGAVVSMVKVHTIDNLAVSGEYYQIPTLSFTDLEYGSYMVSLSVAKAIAVNEDNELVEGEYRSTYYLDGIRVYNPIQNLEGDATVIEGYGNELGAVFQEVRSHLTTAASFNSGNTTVDGFVFIDLNGKLDGTGEEGDLVDLVADYVDYGPKHEVYLAPGQGIAFKVDNAGAAAGFYLGIKSPASKEGMVRVSNGTNQSTIDINHSTDLYYKLSPDSDGYIVVINEGSTLISLTKLRITGSSAGIVSADTEEMTAYVTGFRSLPQVDYIEQPEPPADPKPNPYTGELLEKILWLLENLFGSLRGWFDLP